MTIEETVIALKELADHNEIEILSTFENAMTVFDCQDGKEITYNIQIDKSTIADKIYINQNIPVYFQPNKQKVAKYIMDHLPTEALFTLNKICFICGDDDDTEALAEMFDEDPNWVEEIICHDELGKLWFEYNSVLINVKNIIESAEEVAAIDRSMGYQGNAHSDTLVQIAVTLIHEMRHLMLDTNIVLSEDDYPIELNSEQQVEEFARNIVEIHGCDIY